MAHRTCESGANPFIRRNDRRISTQSRAEAAANGDVIALGGLAVSTHSRTKAAATISSSSAAIDLVSTHSRAKAAASAAPIEWIGLNDVSTHSRAKAADSASYCFYWLFFSFNTQPREGGCSLLKKAIKISVLNTVFR